MFTTALLHCQGPKLSKKIIHVLTLVTTNKLENQERFINNKESKKL